MRSISASASSEKARRLETCVSESTLAVALSRQSAARSAERSVETSRKNPRRRTPLRQATTISVAPADEPGRERDRGEIEDGESKVEADQVARGHGEGEKQ